MEKRTLSDGNVFEREWGERNRERDWVLNIGTLQKGYVGVCKIVDM